jgi:hypothetical protein
MKKLAYIVSAFLIVPFITFSQSPLLSTFNPPESLNVGSVMEIRVTAGADATLIQNKLNEAIEQSDSNHTVRVLFAASAEYRISGAESSEPILKIEPRAGHKPVNIEIDGQGCTFVVTSWTRFMRITEADNVIIKNFRLTYNPKNITQGVIDNIHNEVEGYYDVTIDEGFPLLNTPRFTESDLRWMIPMKKLDDGTWGMKEGMPTILGYKWGMKTLGDRRFRLHIKASLDHGRLPGPWTDCPLRKKLNKGDRVALLSRTDGRSAFYIQRCNKLVLRDIEVNHSPASVIGDHFSEQSSYVGLKIQPSEGELFTATADGIFVTNQRNGPWIENCTFRGIGDDAIVLKNSAGNYIGNSQNTSLPYSFKALNNRWLWLQPGDSIAFFDMQKRKHLGTHEITKVSNTDPDVQINVDLKTPPSPDINKEDENIWVYNLNNQSNGFVIKNNVIMDHRRWAILCSAADGSIMSNQIVRSQNTAIYLVNSDNYYANKTGAPPRNIEIVNNRFENTFHAENERPFAVIASRINGRIEVTRNEAAAGDYSGDWNGIENIKILNNVFKGWDNISYTFSAPNSTKLISNHIYAIYLRDGKNAIISGNIFEKADSTLSKESAIKIVDFDHVIIENNTFISNPAVYTDKHKIDNHDEVKIYPNPVSKTLTIEPAYHYQNLQVSIFTISGQKLDVGLKRKELDISSLPPGSYILIAEIDGKLFMKKIVKL